MSFESSSDLETSQNTHPSQRSVVSSREMNEWKEGQKPVALTLYWKLKLMQTTRNSPTCHRHDGAAKRTGHFFEGENLGCQQTSWLNGFDLPRVCGLRVTGYRLRAAVALSQRLEPNRLQTDGISPAVRRVLNSSIGAAETEVGRASNLGMWCRYRLGHR